MFKPMHLNPRTFSLELENIHLILFFSLNKVCKNESKRAYMNLMDIAYPWNKH